MKSARKVKARRHARRSPALSLSARVERLEKTLLFPSAARKVETVAASRLTKLCANGSKWMDAQDGGHVAVLDSKTGLTWAAEPAQGGANLNHVDAVKACGALNLLGKHDWRAPTIDELLSIVDYTRHDPALDTDYFKGPYGWTWSSTLYKGSAGYAWLVSLSLGYSYIDDQAIQLRVRAVRAGQQLGL